jgi:hypothetical protein
MREDGISYFDLESFLSIRIAEYRYIRKCTDLSIFSHARRIKMRGLVNLFVKNKEVFIEGKLG